VKPHLVGNRTAFTRQRIILMLITIENRKKEKWEWDVNE